MNIIGVKMSKPQRVDLVLVVFWAAVGGLIGAAIPQPLVGEYWKHIAGLMLSGALSGLVAACGASFGQAGLRGTVICAVAGAIGYGLIVCI